MQEKPLLTIAIPTYNRLKLLDETLQSVLRQVTPQVEILVCSNASQDGTDDLMEGYCKKYEFIRYLKSDINRGIDANIHKCTEEARGEFVHLLSDDDILLPGAIDELLRKIEGYPETDFFYFNVRSFHAPFRGESYCDPPFEVADDILFDDKNAFVEQIGVFATLVSAFVLRRSVWNSVPDKGSYIGTDIYLTYVLFQHIARSRSSMFLKKAGVAIRAEYTGNYRIFYAFAYQWGRLLLHVAPSWGYDRPCMKRIFRKTIIFDLPHRVYSIRSKKIASSFDLKSLGYLFRYTWRFPVTWMYVVTAFFLPKTAHDKLYSLGRFVHERIKPLKLLVR